MSDWRSQLTNFFDEDNEAQERKEPPFTRFVREVVIPAFEEIKSELAHHGRAVTIRDSGATASLLISNGGNEEMSYAIRERLLPNGPLPCADVRARERKGLKLVTIESMVRSGSDFALEEVTMEHIIQHCLQHYMSRVKPR